MSSSFLDVSVIVPFADSEEWIGSCVSRIAAHLRERGERFEILCIDEDSRDNSHVVLGLLRSQIPELRVHATSGRGRGFAAGAALARGAVVWLLTPQAAAGTLAPFAGPYQRVAAGELDVVAFEGRFSVCRRSRTLDVLKRLRGGSGAHARLARRAEEHELRVEHHPLAGGASNRGARPWARLFDTAPFRVALSWIDNES